MVPQPVLVSGVERPPIPTNPVSDQPSAALGVCCLGRFRVYQRDRLVEDWASRKGKLVFKYLVTHRERPISKEVLMDLFWPDSSPDAARNNLNVAIYGLRQSLRQNSPSESHILYQDDCYLINPDLDIWVDVEAFTEHLTRARELEDSAPSDAIREYHLAEALYTGDFLEEDRYEDWASAQRQQLKDAYLGLLERLSRHYYVLGEYTTCVTQCRKVLAVDSCRERAPLDHAVLRATRPAVSGDPPVPGVCRRPARRAGRRAVGRDGQAVRPHPQRRKNQTGRAASPGPRIPGHLSASPLRYIRELATARQQTASRCGNHSHRLNKNKSTRNT